VDSKNVLELQQWIAKLYEQESMLRMGHHQSAEDLNLGLGWLYYALARVQRCTNAVVIGSYRGFVPLVLARALSENRQQGQVVFVDPSYVDDFWAEPSRVEAHFRSFGVDNIKHFKRTTQDFAKSPEFEKLQDVDLLFIDGYHTEEQARFDHETIESKLTPDAYVLFHDSIRKRRSRLYGEDNIYEHSVCNYIEKLKGRVDLQVFDFPFDSGVTLVRKLRR
jgi:predicted O-methyltransferase YrrM